MSGDQPEQAASLVIASRGATRPLEPLGLDPVAIAALGFDVEGWGPSTVAEVLQRNGALGLVVTHGGRLVYEWYAPESAASRRNPCFSVTKSLTGTMTAAAVAAGLLDRDARVGELIPELAGSGFRDATVGDVADMTVSLGYDEDYDDASAPSADGTALGFGNYLVAAGLADGAPDAPRSIRALLARIGAGPEPHGHTFTYATPVSDMLGWLLERARGRAFAELLVEHIWSPMGAERDAFVVCDPAGTPLMGGGLSATTRDLARIGLLLNDRSREELDEDPPAGSARGTGASTDAGAATVTAPITPAVIGSMRGGGDRDAFARSHYAYLRGYSYRDQWWVTGDRSLSGWGIHGQLLWVDPDADVVIATHCGGPSASDARRDLEQDALCRAIVAASAEWT